MRKNNISRGVSPVIGTVLLVGLTVGLVILTTSIAFDVGDNIVSTSPDVSVEITQVSANVVETVITNNENVEELYIINNNGEEIGSERISEVGDTYVIDANSDDFSPGDTVSIVVVLNGNESVLTTFRTKIP